MNESQLELVQASLGQLLPVSERTAELFYGRLFELDPSTRVLFKDDMQAQNRKFMLTLAYMVHALHRLDRIRDLIRDLAHDHVTYGVEPGHYATVKEALLWALGETLGADYTPAVRQAWDDAFETISAIMLEAATQPPS